MESKQSPKEVILIGAGIMSGTLGVLMKELAPDWKITVYEKLPQAGEESSNEWNNAGTGHSALCELNYTPELEDGTIDTTKAIKVNEQFQLSKQFWSYLVEKELIKDPDQFIMPLPHISFVQGKDDVEYLRKRYESLVDNPLFKGMEYTEDPEVLKEWIPLIMEGRVVDEPIAATKMDSGTDVNFGALTRILFDYLATQDVDIHYNHKVTDIKRKRNGKWEVKVENKKQGLIRYHEADFVFIGAGGGSLPLLQMTGIPESKHIGGFPVSGLFLVCENEEIIEKHHAKVYGKAKIGAPPMSVPHLDTRYIGGKKELLFGPFAGFSPKFLKSGSYLDLISSVKPSNVTTMLAAGLKEMGLTKYLIQQLLLTEDERIEELREFVPNAKKEDWKVLTAGQRVQIIKDTEKGGKGTIQFGTEVITSKDGTVAALLGASPGASTAVYVMLEVLERCFPENMNDWEPKIKEMIPSYGISLMENPELLEEITKKTDEILGL
ncbi:MAG: malate:quinone oxidoreductase [Bacilli bacterium]|nr:malate:quinone oxidoreductase [Bacilli bacterium]